MTIVENSSAEHDELTENPAEISQRLVAARKSAAPLADFPGVLPGRLEDAYQIQSLSIESWPDTIGGWKVGGIPPAFRSRAGTDRLAGPIFQSLINDVEAGGCRSMPIFVRGFAAVEAEFVFRLGASIAPSQRVYSDEELQGFVAALHIGAEIASSPMAEVNNLGPSCVVCDFGNNAGLLVGPGIPDWAARSPDELSVAVSIDGELAGSADASAVDGGLLQALRFLVESCAKRGLVLNEGSYVSCGAVTGIHEVSTSSKAAVDFGEFGAFDVTFEAMMPVS